MAERGKSLSELLASIPYASYLDMSVDQHGDEITAIMRANPRVTGNPHLPALHGGAIGAFLEITATVHLAYEAQATSLPKPVGITIDYLRPGRLVDTFARAHITKHGKRVGSVRVEAWQEDRLKPIATAHGHFLIKVPEETPETEKQP